MRWPALAAAAAVVLFAPLVARAQSGGYHEDEKLGYKVRAPAGWNKMPLQVDERWIVAKYLSDKEFFDKESGYGFKPEMRVILFAHAVTKDRGVSTRTEGSDEESTTFVEIKNPYKDYKDYLERNYSGGGWFISLEEEQESKDLKWTLIEIKVEKLTYTGKKRIVAGVFHAPDADYVVQFEVLEDDYAKLKGTLYGCLKSFQLIERTGSIAPATTEPTLPTDETELSPAERKKHRAQIQQTTFNKAKEALPKGWDAFEVKDVYVLSHVDRKYAMKVVTQILAVRKWLDKTFEFMGDEYVRNPIVRICENPDEERAYFDGSGDAWSNPGGEIVTHKDSGSGAMSYEFEYVNRRIVSQWFHDKDPEFYWRMPSWLEGGLKQYVGTARPKGANLDFKPDDWERERLREAASKGEILGVRDMMLRGAMEFSFSQSSQSAKFLRFLLEGPGRGLKGAKDLLETYMTAVRDLAREKAKKEAEEAEKPAEASEGPKTEEEEDEEFRNRGSWREEWMKKETEFLKEIFDRAFGDWDEATWERMERAWAGFAE